MYDAVWAWAYALHDVVITQKDSLKMSFEDVAKDAAGQSAIREALYRTVFYGASGQVTFGPATGDRVGLAVSFENLQNGEEVEVMVWHPDDRVVAAPGQEVVWRTSIPDGSGGYHNTSYAHTPTDGSEIFGRKPVIDSVEPQPAILAGGETATFRGKNFVPGQVVVVIGVKICTDAAFHMDGGHVSCVVPEGTGQALDVTISFNGVQSDPTPLFSYDLPIVFSTQRTWSVPGTIVQVHGSNFPLPGSLGRDSDYIMCRKNSVKTGLSGPMGVARWVDDNTVDCELPLGTPSGVGELELSNDKGRSWNGGIVINNLKFFNESRQTPSDGTPFINPPSVVHIALLVKLGDRDEPAIIASVNESIVAINNAAQGATLLMPGSKLVLKIFDTKGKSDPEDVARFEALVKSTPTLIGVAGPLYSNAAVGFAARLGVLKVPVCSFGSASMVLADSEVFPFFVRTNPTNVNYAAAVATLAQSLAWTRVAILTSDDAFAGDLGSRLATILGAKKVVYHGMFQGGEEKGGAKEGSGQAFAHIVRHAREIVKRGSRVIFIEGSLSSEVTNAVAALATVICGDGETAFAPTEIPIGCFKGYVLERSSTRTPFVYCMLYFYDNIFLS